MNWLCQLLSITCTAGTISGAAWAYDGDTIYITNQPVRLFGIDAEELDEPNGYAAREHLRSLTNGWTITCKWDGWNHNRRVGICHYGTPNSDGRLTVSLNEMMVADGYALDCAYYSHGRYRQLEPPGARKRLIQKGYCK